MYLSKFSQRRKKFGKNRIDFDSLKNETQNTDNTEMCAPSLLLFLYYSCSQTNAEEEHMWILSSSANSDRYNEYNMHSVKVTARL